MYGTPGGITTAAQQTRYLLQHRLKLSNTESIWSYALPPLLLDGGVD